MILRVPLAGSGVEGDPYHVDLPTYQLLAASVARKLALVRVPDDDIPDNAALKAALAAALDLVSADQAPLAAALRLAWRLHIDARYHEHAGEYTLDRK